MTTRLIITPAMLRRLNPKPCREQYKIFCTEWPDGAPVTLATVRRARKINLSLRWFADKFLTAPARAEYEKVRDPALAEYEKVCDAAWAEYEKVRGAALAEYEKVHDAAWAEYEKVRDAAWAEYEKVRDAALVKVVRAQLKGELK